MEVCRPGVVASTSVGGAAQIFGRLTRVPSVGYQRIFGQREGPVAQLRWRPQWRKMAKSLVCNGNLIPSVSTQICVVVRGVGMDGNCVLRGVETEDLEYPITLVVDGGERSPGAFAP